MTHQRIRTFFQALTMMVVILAACDNKNGTASTPNSTDQSQPATDTSSPDTPIESPSTSTPKVEIPGKLGPTEVLGPDGEPLPPWGPRPEDAMLSRGQAFVDEADLLVLESFPPQYMLALQGNLPTPCHQLRILISPPDDQKRIQVEVYSVSKPGENCTDVLEPFIVDIPLGSFPAGHYSIYINEELLGEFDA